MCHQCGNPLLILRAKQAKWSWHAWKRELGHPIKSYYSMFIFVSSIKLNHWTSCDLVFLVLLWVVIIYIFKNSFRVQETDRVVERNLFSAVCENQTSSTVVITYKLPFILYTWRWFKKTLDIILRESDKVALKIWRCPGLLSLEKQKKNQEMWKKWFESWQNPNFPHKTQFSLCTKGRPALIFPHINSLDTASLLLVFSWKQQVEKVELLFIHWTGTLDGTFYFPGTFFKCKKYIVKCEHGFPPMLMLHTLLSSCASHSGVYWWTWVPAVQLENWKRLANMRWTSAVSGKIGSWKFTPWGTML